MSLLHIGGSGSSVVAPEGVDFDGVSDYLSRSSDLVGNMDSKTFTFSAWVYFPVGRRMTMLEGVGTADSYINISESNVHIKIGNGLVLEADGSIPVSTNTWHNILVSVNMDSTSTRKVYIDDKLVSLNWNTYVVGGSLDFTPTSWTFFKSTAYGSTLSKGRAENVFLDYTYRDLSIEANRRLFITADGKPTPTATLKALNPILYLPMKDNATAHINEGTGGNFTLNGTIATSERGANQDNCVASYFDGSADYLSRTSLTGIADGKQFTFSCTFRFNTTYNYIMYLSNADSSKVFVSIDASGSPTIRGYDAINGYAFNVTAINGTFVSKSTYTLTCSFDVTDVSKRFIYINGVNKTSLFTFSAWGNNTIRYTQLNVNTIARDTSTYSNANIGELYFDTKYIDLATNNPFWDKDTNKPIPVRKVIANTGVTPLIAMPLDASNAGKNYGTGGDFTANSSPYVGARGASEFWARSAKFDGSTGYLSKASAISSNTTKTITFVGYINELSSVNETRYLIDLSSGRFYIYRGADGLFNIFCLNQYQTTIMRAKSSNILGGKKLILLSFDLTNTSKRNIYINGSSVNMDWDTYTNQDIPMQLNYNVISGSSYKWNGDMSSIYISDQYIDFSQESNRLKFVDGLGYPTNLKEKIDAGIIPKPLIYLPFDDTTNLGKNLGTGGDFTINGTITAGADVLG